MTYAETLPQRAMEVGMQASIVAVLKTRFTRVPTELRETVSDISDTKQLEKLQRAAVLCAEIKDFAEALIAPTFRERTMTYADFLHQTGYIEGYAEEYAEALHRTG